MSARDVVEEIYDILAGDVSPDDIYLDLLGIEDPTFDDVGRLCRGTDIDPDDLEERALFVDEEGFRVTDWTDDERIAYLQDRNVEEMTPLELVQLLRYDDAREGRIPNERRELNVTGAMIDVADELATVTGDDRYAELFG